MGHPLILEIILADLLVKPTNPYTTREAQRVSEYANKPSDGQASLLEFFIVITPRSTLTFLAFNLLEKQNYLKSYTCSIGPCAKKKKKSLKKNNNYEKCKYQRTINTILLPLGIR